MRKITKECPFCHSNNIEVIIDNENDTHRIEAVVCLDCPCMLENPDMTLAELIDLWEDR